MRLADAHVGQAVVYAPTHGPREDGVVIAVGRRFVFVRFRGQHPDAHAKACSPGDLEPAAGQQER